MAVLLRSQRIGDGECGVWFLTSWSKEPPVWDLDAEVREERREPARDLGKQHVQRP